MLSGIFLTVTEPAPDRPEDRSAEPGRLDASASYLLARLRLIESRVRRLVAHRRDEDAAPDDPFRGLYISDDHIDRMLAETASSRLVSWEDEGALKALEEEASTAEATGIDIRLRSLARRADLAELDLDILLVCLAPDLDSRFERLYGYLNDDVTRRRPTIGLALELAGASPWSATSRSRFAPGAPLIENGLVLVEEPDRPLLSRTVRVPDRVAGHLLGDARADPAVAGFIRATTPAATSDRVVAPLGTLIGEGTRLAYLREQPGASAPPVAVAALNTAGHKALVVDAGHIGPSEDLLSIARVLRREAVIDGAGLVIGPVEALLSRGDEAVRVFSSMEGPVVLHGKVGWDPNWSRHVPVLVDLARSSPVERREQWSGRLAERIDGSAGVADASIADVAAQFTLTVEQVERAVTAATLEARMDGLPLELPHLRAGARLQNGTSLDRLARRIQPAVGWDDLVLASSTLECLHELAGRARCRDRVLDEWGMRPGGGRGRGITVLFGGDSGTGKTMSAEVVAGELGLDLYTVNLATVVDKYVGETEKNLERIFTEADGVNAVLLFDEADALFGKRSEVRDANDRYANIEVAYLLQRMESFDGLAILATNLRANVDEAFARRLDMVIDFPTPDFELRLRLWDKCLAPGVPRSADVELGFLARSFDLSGGNIRSIALTAAYMAADRGTPVGMEDLVRSVQREYRKLGRLVVPGEFGRYYDLVSG